MDLRAKREQLRRRTVSGGRAEGDGWRPGAVWMADDGEAGIEWLVAGGSPESAGWICVPLDTAPFLGSDDLDLSDLTGEPTRARCAYAIEIGRAIAASARILWQLSPEGLERVRQRLAELETVFRDRSSEGELRDGSAGSALGSVDGPGPDPADVGGDGAGVDWLARVRAEAHRLGGPRVEAPGEGEVEGGVTVGRAAGGGPAGERADRDGQAGDGAAGHDSVGEEAGGRILPGGFPWREATAWVLAAGFAAWSVGVTLQLGRAVETLEGAHGPMLVPTSGAGEVRIGAAERGLRVRVHAADGEAALVYLVFRDAPAGQTYRVRLEEEATGRTVFESRPVAGVEHLLVLPAEALGAGGPDGIHRFRLLVVRRNGDDGRGGPDGESNGKTRGDRDGEQILDQQLLEIGDRARGL